MLRLIAEGPVTVIDDQHGHPTLVGDLVTGTLAALDADANGILHLTNAGTTSWFGLAREVAAFADLDVDRVRPVRASEFSTDAARPANSVLESVRLDELGLDPLPDYHEPLEAAVARLRSS
jgi:dTDP-4-dehydrorhamnose reductase